MKFFRLPRWPVSPLIGAIVTAGAGLIFSLSNLGEPLERVSYDLPFALRRNMRTNKVAIVYLDETAAQTLAQPFDRPWDRRIYAKLLDRLGKDGAELICFDLLFSTASVDPAADAEFASAMAQHGGVILGAEYTAREQFGAEISTIEKPTPLLRDSQAGWGLLLFRPIDPDGAVRQLCVGYEGNPTLATTAASHMGALFPSGDFKRQATRWLNYYGPAGEAFDGVSIADALRQDGVPPGFFRGRTVFIGGRYLTGSLRTAKDEFGNPYSRWGRRFSPGVEIHATSFLNLLRGEWLRRLPGNAEIPILVMLGFVLGGFLSYLRPHLAVAMGLLVAAVVLAASCVLAWHFLAWFPWAIVLAAQVPVGLGWSVGTQYFLEQRRRAALRRAFSYYLSPEMADRIADSNFDLRPGGAVVEATIVFTDLENFTTLSEELPVEDVSKILIAYFTETTKYILENHGTIIKYIGDSVMATWNAPVSDPDHGQHAARAACSLSEASNKSFEGYSLRTRVGIHTGRALAGNLGSPFRFDYTLIGDTTNFASRLEGMNKFLGTQILLSEATAKIIGAEFVLRRLGKFVLKGKTLPVELFELMGCKKAVDASNEPDEWYSSFSAGVDAFASGDLGSAAVLMRQTISQRGGKDGPAEFYLRQIAAAELYGYTGGLIRMDEK